MKSCLFPSQEALNFGSFSSMAMSLTTGGAALAESVRLPLGPFWTWLKPLSAWDGAFGSRDGLLNGSGMGARACGVACTDRQRY